MQKIFVVEDDDNIREMLVYALRTAGFSGLPFEDADLALKALESEIPAMILLDIMLPGSDGLEILKLLKKSDRYSSIPVIMLTAKGSELDRIKGLDLGADDYIVKPFSVMEVISRIKAVLRRCQKDDSPINELVIENIVLNADKHTVFVDGRALSLTFKEFELLNYLMANAGIVLSRDRILEKVWGFDYSGESRTVDMHIKTLRQKLGEAGSAITTIRGVGYKIGV